MGILIWVFSMHSENGRISRQASPTKSAHSEQCVTSKCYPCSIPVNREMAKPLMVDQWVIVTLLRHTIAWGFLFSESFSKKYLGGRIQRTNNKKVQRNFQNFFHILNLHDLSFQSITQLPNFQNLDIFPLRCHIVNPG